MKIIKQYGSQILFFIAGMLTSLPVYDLSMWFLLIPVALIIVGVVYSNSQMESENIKAYGEGVNDARPVTLPPLEEIGNPVKKCKLCMNVAAGEYGGEHYCREHLDEIANSMD